MVAEDLINETTEPIEIEETSAKDVVDENIVDDGKSKKNARPEATVGRGVFSDFIGKLQNAQKNITALNKDTAKIVNSDNLTAVEKQAKYMELFNAAVLSFMRLPHELDRLCKTTKQQLWLAKEHALKQIY